MDNLVSVNPCEDGITLLFARLPCCQDGQKVLSQLSQVYVDKTSKLNNK